MKRICLICVVSLSLGGCSQLPSGFQAFINGPADVAGEATGSDVVRPKPRPASFAPLPSENAVTVEDFDTTSSAERTAASATADANTEEDLGQTIATLGSPATPGFWLETPLVSQRRPGRVVAVENGESVLVELIPVDGPAGAGSHLSLAALRLLGVGLTGLHELLVFGR